MSNVARRTALTAIAPVSWGTTYLVTTELLPPDRPLMSGVLRALPAGLIAIAIGRRLPRGSWWWRAAVLGLLNIGAFFALLFLAAYRLPGGVAATLGAVGPLATTGFAFALLGERPTRWRLVWAVAGLGGVAMMVLRPGAGFDLLGVVAGLAGPFAMSAGVVLTRRWGRPVGVVPFAGWQLTAGGLFLLPVAVLVEGAPPHVDLAAVGGYAWLSVVGALIAYSLWFRGIGELPVVAVSFLALLSPVVATALGWIVLGQGLTALQTVGFAVALLSILAAQLPAPRLNQSRTLLSQQESSCVSPSSEQQATSAAGSSPKPCAAGTRSQP
ncbi:EamA family transporter [Luteipulveratus halotolerans]|uniref:EamA family transporter n=1 Tax=Luteipulveratus halotolerans TaxID=1631356 RepID=UPI0008FBD294|nr:EamA family transporter [Luteipulveratus halotolerans]